MKRFIAIHLFLLAYIIAALSFWWLSLERQSRVIYEQELAALSATGIGVQEPQSYAQAKAEVALQQSKRSKQYLGEGLTFLFVILVGSSIVYTSYRFNAKLSRQQNNFMLSVTHELKSPIAAMKLTLQTLQKHQLDPAVQQQLLSRCINESDRLNELCNNVLIASQMEGGQYKNVWQICDVSRMVQHTFDTYAARYAGRFEAQIASAIQVETDEFLLQLVLNNLIENAIKYTPQDSPIAIAVQQQSGRCLIQVKDMGPGISEAEKKKVFQKFYRVGNEDTRKTKGTGLGLYLSLKIIKYLKGNIVLKDNKPQGSIFEIVLNTV